MDGYQNQQKQLQSYVTAYESSLAPPSNEDSQQENSSTSFPGCCICCRDVASLCKTCSSFQAKTFIFIISTVSAFSSSSSSLRIYSLTLLLVHAPQTSIPAHTASQSFTLQLQVIVFIFIYLVHRQALESQTQCDLSSASEGGGGEQKRRCNSTLIDRVSGTLKGEHSFVPSSSVWLGGMYSEKVKHKPKPYFMRPQGRSDQSPNIPSATSSNALWTAAAAGREGEEGQSEEIKK